LWLCF